MYLGRRYQPFPVWCPRCGPTGDVELRVKAMVTCVRCDTLLTDEHGYTEPEPDPLLVRQQNALRRELTLPRIRRFPTFLHAHRLMNAVLPVMTDRWPPLAKGEPPARRAQAIAAYARGGAYESPAAVAVLMRLCWGRSKKPARRARLAQDARIRATDWLPPPSTSTRWSDRRMMIKTRRSLLRAHLDTLGIGPEHVPTMILLGSTDILPARQTLPFRTAMATALTRELHAARVPSSSASDPVARMTATLRTSPWGIDLLADLADALVADGLADRERRRSELRRARSVSPLVMRRLPRAAQEHPQPTQHAAAWVWVDATAGGPRGGPHPHLSHTSLREFDRLLGPDGRLELRDHWTSRIAAAQLPNPSLPRRDLDMRDVG